ncbi:BMA-PRKL-1, isoform h [Dirofilaria immitis]|nr:BMA-PRKL-1, isoform h [Dirofilaria immitis]
MSNYEDKKQNDYSGMPLPSSLLWRKHQRCSSCSSSESDGDDAYLLNYLAASLSQFNKTTNQGNENCKPIVNRVQTTKKSWSNCIFVMASKLPDFFRNLRLVPMPFGEYQRNNPDLPPIMVNFRSPDLWRTLPIEFKDDKERLFIDPTIICKLSKICADKVKNLEKAGQELVIRLDNITCDAMERLLFAIYPTVYGQYPIPPTVFDVDIICSVACSLQMDMIIKMCEKVLENDVYPELTPTDLLINFFSMAYRCKLKSTLQAKLFIKILECEHWKLRNFREISRSISCKKKAPKEHCYVRGRKFWIDDGLDLPTKELLRFCIYNELLFSHVTITVQTKRCNKTLCLNCEARFCVERLAEFLEDVRKAEKSPDVLKKLHDLVLLNSSVHDTVRVLVNVR